jgi:two-component system, chemotaxis family, sensor histidine kinase and response regulator PixL
MTLDPTIREQTYQYFLQEAPELLQALEEGLLRLQEAWGINEVNNLMRATHTLKGAATSVGLDTIARVAHSLEDIFRVLCQPNVSLDPEAEALLFEGMECLRLPLMAELTGRTVDHAQILDRAAAIFALLQEKLGDCFGQEAYLPTSADLGFDMAQSLFEVGVAQRLEQIALALESAPPEEVLTVLRTQAEVFLGLAESLNLVGFGAIAHTVLTALDHHPDQAVIIAHLALADFQAGQTAVLGGDRSQGGEPSSELQQWASLPPRGNAFSLNIDNAKSDNAKSDNAKSDNAEVEVNELIEETLDAPLLESIWGQQSASDEPALDQHLEELTQPGSGATVEQILSQMYSSPQPERSVAPLNSLPQKDPVAPSATVRVAVKHLDHLNYSIGELITNQNRQSLQTDQLQMTSKTLLNQIKQQRQLLSQLQDHLTRQASWLKQSQTGNPPGLHSKPPTRAARKASKKSIEQTRSDFLARDYGSNAALIQLLVDHLMQLAETADAIDLLTRESNQTLEKQHQLLTSTQSALIESRMLPLGEIFGRFPNALQQLETLHNKPIALKLHGTEVLVDKAVAEKLFDPLLHLVRNAFDHGIESTNVRQQRGKPEKGQIAISAYYQGRHLVIEVQDDGNGLDFDQIRQRAIEQQLISREQAKSLNQVQLTDLLFEPGFSTVAQVSDLSGRGVGLDVVRNQLQSLRGWVMVESKLHRGTTFKLQIPLSLTIAQLFVCEVGDKTYALLDDTVEQILIPLSSQIQERNGGKFLRWNQGADEKLAPIYSLTSILDYDAATPLPMSFQAPLSAKDSINPVIVIRCQDTLLGLEVDRLIGEQQLVIRPLGAMIGSPSYIHGATVLADGRLALVVDGAMLLQKVFDQQRAATVNHPWAKTPSYSLPSSPERSLLPPPLVDLSAKSDTRILIVDDSITTRQSLTLTLQKAGYRVFQAQDGYEALEQFQHHSDIRLVICDIEMPRMSGFELLRNRQQIPLLANIPIVMLSSQSGNKHQMLASQLGATVYMVKPYMEHKLLAMVADLLEKFALNPTPTPERG